MNFIRGRLIAFSGIDGAGKSTQIDLLLQSLIKIGKKPVYLWTRGGYTGPFNAFKVLIRRIIGRKLPPSGRNNERDKAFKKKWVRNSWLFLAMLDLMLVYGVYVRIKRAFGQVIIVDRYLLDTWIDFKLNFPEVNIDKWILWKLLLLMTPKPDAAFLMLIPVKECLYRSRLKKEPFSDTEDVLEKRLILYKKISFQFYLLDGLKPIDLIHRKIKSYLNNENKLA